MTRAGDPDPGGRQPILLLPPVVGAAVAVLVVVHLAQTFALDAEGQLQFALWFGFIPARYWLAELVPGGLWPLLWTPLTHGLLHAGWEHLLINCAWLAVFGTPIAQRYGPSGFLILLALSTIAGALAFAPVGVEGFQVLMGASGGIAGLTGAAIRFMFEPVQVARHPETGETIVLGRRLATLADVFRKPRPRAFFIFWVGINALAPLLPLFTGVEIAIAWQAHLGGFFAGLLLVPLFEPQRRVI